MKVMETKFNSVREQQMAMIAEMEQRRKVTEMITEKVEYILGLDADSGVTWGGSKADLLELLHEVYVRGRLTMPDGCPMMMTYLVTHCFRNLHLTVMKNFRSHMQRAVARKGIRGGNLVERIRLMMFEDKYRGEQRLQMLWNSMIMGPQQ